MDWVKIDKRLEVLNRRASIIAKLRPINLYKERRYFFNSRNYNPQFEYPTLKYSYDKDIVELEAMKFESNPLGILFDRKRREILKKIKLINSIGTDKITQESIDLFGILDEQLVRSAERELHDFTKKKDGRRLKLEEVKSVVKNTLEKYDLSHWGVIEKDRVADCSTGKNTVFLRPDAGFSRERLKKTVAHEIETHVLRKENGTKQPFNILAYGTAGHQITEEGLAIFNERIVSKKMDEKRFWPAAYMVAVDIARKSSFSDVYDMMRWFNFSKLRSWVIATKVKRGLRDTSKPGGYTKDQIYFIGQQKVNDYFNKGGKLSDLYMGKIGINDIALIKKIDSLKKPAHLPRFIKNYE